jgi:CHAD domain-containing protein
MRTFVEYERKLDAQTGFELPALDGEALEPRLFTSFYYDTADYSLSRARITLRRRIEQGDSTWQLKLPRAEDRVEVSAPGGAALPPEELASLLVAHTRRGELAPVAELRTRREGKLLETDRVSAEVTVDNVAVMEAESVADEFVEVEVEVRHGDRRSIDRIVRKLQRAGATAGDGLPKLFRALDLPLADEPQTPSGDGFAKLQARLREQLAEILAHDPATRLGTDPDSLHDMRVGVRRTRALLRVGRKLVANDTSALEAELKWAGEALGAVRDLDVLLAHLRHEANELDATDRRAALELLRKLELEREAAQAALRSALASERYLALLDDYETTLARLEPAAKAPSLAPLARKQLGKLDRSVRALGDEPTDAELHEERKRGKRVRYTAELAGLKAVVKRAKTFQDILGEHQDAVVAQQKLRTLARDATTAEGIALGRLLEREQARKVRARAEWRRAWRHLKRSG